MKLIELFNNADLHQNKIHRPYVIAEIGVNHEGSMDTAKRLVKEAKEGGADAVKFQTYKADTIASKDSPAYWDTSKEPTLSQHELFKRHDKFWKDEMQELKDYCDKVDIEFMSTPFDVESAEFLNDMMDVFKISSSDITNKPFIEYICSFEKPIILSTGASDLEEVQDAVNWIKPFNVSLALLHCVLNYPTPDKNANLGMISGLKKAFPDNIIGYSDHTLPKEMKVCEIATLLGAIIIEKHFTMDKKLPGPDQKCSIEPKELASLIEQIRNIEQSLGDGIKKPSKLESEPRQFKRRGIYAATDLKSGKVLLEPDVMFLAPSAENSSVEDWPDFEGKKIASDIPKGSVISRSNLI